MIKWYTFFPMRIWWGWLWLTTECSSFTYIILNVWLNGVFVPLFCVKPCVCAHSFPRLLFFQVSLLEFSRDRKMMSVLCSRKHQEIMFSKGAPESIISRCTNILCNDDGSVLPLTAEIRAELETRFNRLDLLVHVLSIFYLFFYNF